MPLKDYEFRIDASLPMKCKGWLEHPFGVKTRHVLEMIALLASDESFYLAAREAGDAVILSKDVDLLSCSPSSGRRLKFFGLLPESLK